VEQYDDALLSNPGTEDLSARWGETMTTISFDDRKPKLNILPLLCGGSDTRKAPPGAVSEFGKYEKYSEPQLNPSEHIAAINRSGVPLYQWSAWFDIYTRDAPPA